MLDTLVVEIGDKKITVRSRRDAAWCVEFSRPRRPGIAPQLYLGSERLFLLIGEDLHVLSW